MPEDGAPCPVVIEDVLIGYEAYGALRGLGECGILERADGIGWEKASQGSIRLGAREEESLLAITEKVTVLEEYDYVPGWTNCFAYESISKLTHNSCSNTKRSIKD